MALPILTLLGIFSKVMDFAKWMAGFIDRRKAKQEGRTERDLEVQKETIEVLARNAEGQQAVDGMTEEELDKFLPKP